MEPNTQQATKRHQYHIVVTDLETNDKVYNYKSDTIIVTAIAKNAMLEGSDLIPTPSYFSGEAFDVMNLLYSLSVILMPVIFPVLQRGLAPIPQPKKKRSD